MPVRSRKEASEGPPLIQAHGFGVIYVPSLVVQPQRDQGELTRCCGAMDAPVRIPRDGGHDSMLMADSVPA
ncbi:hypothetical protein [Pseudomonas sp. DCA-1]|uniref:hypothetical protein n=1 Tax=Pseudomonas sp. DCA-1 TaxID=3344874 RepID=UPI0039777721